MVTGVKEYEYPKCPHCGTDTGVLHVNVTCTMSVVLDEGSLTYDSEEEILDVVSSYFCPYCEKTIADTKEEAIKFLKGEPWEMKKEPTKR